MRLFKHYIPINTIVLVISENAIILFSLLLSLKISNALQFYNSKINYINIVTIQLSTILIFYIADLYNYMNINQRKEVVYKVFICCIASFFVISGINFLSNDYIMNSKAFLIYLSISTVRNKNDWKK